MATIDLSKLITSDMKLEMRNDELKRMINTERDRRIEIGKVIGDVYATGRQEDQRNLTNLSMAAQLMLASGDTSTITVFRDGNNVDHELNPLQLLNLWKESMTYVSELYAKSWELKAMNPVPENYTDDSYWPTKE